jgi:hypothetical protein
MVLIMWIYRQTSKSEPSSQKMFKPFFLCDPPYFLHGNVTGVLVHWLLKTDGVEKCANWTE